MTKNFYRSVCFSLGLTLAFGLFQSWLHFQRGTDVYLLPSFPGWVLVGTLISLITSVFLLVYYYRNHFRAAFWTGLVASCMSLGSLLYLVMIRLYPLLGKYPNAVIFLAVMTNLIYATTLLVSNANSRPWLKWAGIVLASLYGAYLATLVLFINTPPYPPDVTFDSIRQWLSLFERIVPVLLLFNFVDELNCVSSDKEPINLPTGLLMAKAMVAILAICTIVLAIQLMGDNYSHTHVSPREMALAQPFEEGSYIGSQGDTLRYRIMKPLDYDSRKRYPLVVGLPYTCWSDNTRQIDACPIAKWLATAENRRKYAAFVFVPRCPPHTGWGGVANTPSVAPLAIKAIRALDKVFSIDTQRRYVSGVSRGGYGAWQLIGTHPELFAAAIPVCGEGDPGQAQEMTSVSVWAFHGAKDMNVPVSGSRDMVKALKKAGCAPRYTEYPHAAHGIWEEVVKTPGLLDWLFAQKQDTPPKASKL
ncbi:MAG: peptidase [Cytophagaceae bacterium]|nr:MAG: peptidase [Cytophagaceae bacterium]